MSLAIMAPKHALAALLLTVGSASAQTASPYWTYTERLASFASPSPYTRYNGEVTTYNDIELRTVSPKVTPTVSAVSTSTYTYTYSDLKVIELYYPTGAVAESDLLPGYDYSATTTSKSTTTSIEFMMQVTMTAPSSCPTAFTVTTQATVTVPSQVTDQVTPTSKETGTSTYTGLYYTYFYETWYLSEGAAPFTSKSDFYYSYYIASCSTPPSSRSTGSSRSGGGYSSDDYDSRFCYGWSCNSSLKTWIIVIATIIPALFLLGFLESFFWFRRLMQGKSAMRFGTCCWVLISLWILCFTRMQDRRSPEDQKLLKEKYKQMSAGAAFKAWLKWGFRHSYPEPLLGQYSRQTVGIVPTGQPLHPAMAQTPGGFPPGAPGAPGAPQGGSLMPVPGQPGQVYYYGPPPPGWVQAPNGQFVPPQGYGYPQQQAGGFYADPSKDGSMVSSSPVSAVGHPQPTFTPPPQQPQPVYQQPQQPVYQQQGVPPQGMAAPPTQRSVSPISGPVSEAPDSQAPRPPQQPPNDQPPNNRDLYE
jgi:hypothetical protein